jgi:hypothetical protein
MVLPVAKAKQAEHESSGVLFVRDADLVAEMDAWIARENAKNPDGPQWSRAMFARSAIRKVLKGQTK